MGNPKKMMGIRIPSYTVDGSSEKDWGQKQIQQGCVTVSAFQARMF